MSTLIEELNIVAEARVQVSKDKKTPDSKAKQVNINLSGEEVAALEAYRASLGVRSLKLTAAGKEALITFLIEREFLAEPSSPPEDE